MAATFFQGPATFTPLYGTLPFFWWLQIGCADFITEIEVPRSALTGRCRVIVTMAVTGVGPVTAGIPSVLASCGQSGALLWRHPHSVSTKHRLWDATRLV